MKRIISCIIAFLLMASLLAGCAVVDKVTGQDKEVTRELAVTPEPTATSTPKPSPTPAPTPPPPTPTPPPPTPTPPPPTPTPEPIVTRTDPATASYIVNVNTGKFHYPWCSSVSQMNESNKWYYSGTRDSLIGQGYDPCKRCNP